MNIRLLYRCLVLLACLPALPLAAKSQTPMELFISHVKETNTFVTVSGLWQADNNFDQAALLQKVEKAQPLTIDYTQVAAFIRQNNTAVNLVIPAIGGGTYTIALAKYDFLSNDFEVHTLGPNNEDGRYSYTPGLYYRGVVAGIPGSVAAFSFFNNEVYGIFSIPGEGNYNVVANTMVGKYYDSNPHYLVYNDHDLKIRQYAPKCGTDQLPEITAPANKTTTTLNNDVFNNCTEVRVFEVGDYALYTTRGHSVTNVTNYLTSLFNNQSTLYKNEGIPIVLKYVQVDSATDAYQHITTANSGIFLDTFGHVTQNTLHGCDLAILASTALNGGYGALGGVAWLQAVCATYHASDFFGPYAFCDLDNSGTVVNFPTYSWDVEVITHEMGHVVGSPHTHRCCWNPPGTGTTAIDGCYTLEGSCAIPVPAEPVGGGTIMSYCHLTSDGINFSNGFGQQPGDTVRYYLAHHFSSTCGATYTPSTPLSNVNRTISANRECTDMTSGITYYWKDNNTASQADDTLVLMVKKNGNNIGTLDSAGFSVSTGTIAGYGGGTGVSISFPAGTTGVDNKNIAMRRFWNITTASEPTTAVGIMFPFLQADTSDVDGSVPGATPLSNFRIYQVSSPADPTPGNGFAGATAADFSFYTFGATASATNWSLTTSGSTNLANMLTTHVSGGGTGFYTYEAAGVTNVNGINSGISIYPNPAHSQLFVSVGQSNGPTVAFQLYSVDGKMVLAQTLSDNSLNTVDVSGLPPGVYFYRAIGSSDTYTGRVLKG